MCDYDIDEHKSRGIRRFNSKQGAKKLRKARANVKEVQTTHHSPGENAGISIDKVPSMPGTDPYHRTMRDTWLEYVCERDVFLGHARRSIRRSQKLRQDLKQIDEEV